MNTTKEPSLTKAADPVSVFMSSNCSRHSGSVAFNGLEKEGVSLADVGKIYPTSCGVGPSAEESTVPPVANWFDNDPMILCRWCGYMLRFGRGPTEHVDFCTICQSESDQYRREVEGE